MTEDERREAAQEIIYEAARDIEFLDVVEIVDGDYMSETIEEDARAIMNLIASAEVSVGWESEELE